MRKILLSLATIFTVGSMTIGATQAVFSATDDIADNIVTNGTVNILAHNFTGNKPIGTTHEFLAPGDWTAWGRAELYNTGNLPVRLYMYVDNLTGADCDKINLQVDTGYAGGNEHARNVVTTTGLQQIGGGANRVEVTGNPPFTTLLPNWSQVIWQRAQLDSTAGIQGATCTWTEYFVAEAGTLPD